jgi:zinc transporter, ZIP family
LERAVIRETSAAAASAKASAPERGSRAGVVRPVLAALLPLLLLAALIAVLVRTGAPGVVRPEGAPPVERLAIERATLNADGIELAVLNDGPDPVTIAQVTVDDAYWAFTARDGQTLGHLGRTSIAIPYPWVAGEAHLVKLVTSTGTTFEHEIAVAVETPRPDARHLAAFTLIGLYVGVIPVALGLLWFPLVARLGRTGIDVLLALTIGLLVFLFVDAAHEGIEAAAELPASYQGTALFVGAAALAYLGLESFGAWLRGRRTRAKQAGSPGAILAVLIATGIGLHNFGEGLAIGAAFALGEAALGALLVIGFTLHNTTEGLAIIAPIAKERPSTMALARLGLIGGLPTIVGAWVGGLVYSPAIAVLFLGLGAGAIAQVVLQIGRQVGATGSTTERFASGPILGGLIAGFVIMLATGMLVG